MFRYTYIACLVCVFFYTISISVYMVSDDTMYSELERAERVLVSRIHHCPILELDRRELLTFRCSDIKKHK
jgi:hypothetical protein